MVLVVFVCQHDGQEDDAIVVAFIVVDVAVLHLEVGGIAVHLGNEGVGVCCLTILIADDVPLAVRAARACHHAFHAPAALLLVACPANGVLPGPFVKVHIEALCAGERVDDNLFRRPGECDRRVAQVVGIPIRCIFDGGGKANDHRMEVCATYQVVSSCNSVSFNIYHPSVFASHSEVRYIHCFVDVSAVIDFVATNFPVCCVILLDIVVLVALVIYVPGLETDAVVIGPVHLQVGYGFVVGKRHIEVLLISDVTLRYFLMDIVYPLPYVVFHLDALHAIVETPLYGLELEGHDAADTGQVVAAYHDNITPRLILDTETDIVAVGTFVPFGHRVPLVVARLQVYLSVILKIGVLHGLELEFPEILIVSEAKGTNGLEIVFYIIYPLSVGPEGVGSSTGVIVGPRRRASPDEHHEHEHQHLQPERPASQPPESLLFFCLHSLYLFGLFHCSISVILGTICLRDSSSLE